MQQRHRGKCPKVLKRVRAGVCTVAVPSAEMPAEVPAVEHTDLDPSGKKGKVVHIILTYIYTELYI